MNIHPKNRYIFLFIFLSFISVFFALRLQFSFSLDQFFPEGDKDLAFHKTFIKDFETDINFLMVGVTRSEGVFDQTFLKQVHDFSLKARNLPFIEQSQSLTGMSYPLKTPFAITSVPVIHIDEPDRYQKDKKRILEDERFVGTLINKEATALVIVLKTSGELDLHTSSAMVNALKTLLINYPFEGHHFLGPAYFTKEMVDMQKREIAVSAIVSSILVVIILFFIFRRPIGVGVAFVSIGMGLLIFLGLLGLWGRQLSAMAALYPVLMIIVGTSDVIHIMSKYIDELQKGQSKREAIQITIKEIGLATLFTSITTAIGFASLMTSRIGPIKDFGLNAAIGVLVAYITVIFFTTSVLVLLQTDQLIKIKQGQIFWDRLMIWFYRFTKNHPRKIGLSAFGIILLSFFGISKINTDYSLKANLPLGKKITTDFLFFEKEFAGFRPLEFAVFAQGDFNADDYEVLMEINKVEEHLKTLPTIQSVQSLTAFYKSINRMNNRNKASAYQMPDTRARFAAYKKLAKKVPEESLNVMLSSDKKKARITSRVKDIGADSLKLVSHKIDQWITENTNPDIAKFQQTGTGLIIDKNAAYIRQSLLKGLGIAVLLVSFLMAFLFKNSRMIIISLIPNIFPLILAGALLGFLGIELEAGIAIVFAVVFGIAVDDTIHFLSKYKISRNKGMDMESAIRITFIETGKAICLTSVILFFGFLVMLFSIHPPSVTVGLLISVTLLSALLSDLFLMPPLIRLFDDREQKTAEFQKESKIEKF